MLGESAAFFSARFRAGKPLVARVNRREVLSGGEVGGVHCITRCVRRAFLCGKDPISGTDDEPRRGLIRQRLEFLASVMGVAVLSYAVLSYAVLRSHFQVILRNRPDVVAAAPDLQGGGLLEASVRPRSGPRHW